jgi:hypothetical protein
MAAITSREPGCSPPLPESESIIAKRDVVDLETVIAVDMPIFPLKRPATGEVVDADALLEPVADAQLDVEQ